jgi:hypothetical protein
MQTIFFNKILFYNKIDITLYKIKKTNIIENKLINNYNKLPKFIINTTL